MHKARSILSAIGLGGALFLGTPFAYATWNGSPYAPGATLDPECVPTDAECTVIAPVTVSSSTPPGSLTYTSATSTWDFIPIGSDGEVLTVDGGGLAWDAPASGGFSTTSADYWAGQRDFFSTSSAAYFLSQNENDAFSTSSAQYFLNQDSGLAFSTSSASYFLSQNQGAAFSTSSASYFLAQNGGSAFSTSSAAYFLSQNQGAAFSSSSANYLIGASSTIPHVAGNGASDILYWTGSGWATRATSTLGVNLADTTGTLPPSQGGLGLSSFSTGDLFYADSPTTLALLPAGSSGQVLKMTAGLPAWGIDLTSGGGSGGNDGIFATSSGIIYPLNTSDTLLVGTNATATPNSVFEVEGQAYVSEKLGIGSTTPSATLSVGGNGYIAGNLTATGNTNLGGNLAVGGAVMLSSALSPGNGGTGLATAPSAGQILAGNALGGYSLAATSSLGLASLLSFSAGTGIGYDPATGIITNTGVVSNAGDWAGTLDGQNGAYYLANSFSTSSALYLLSQNQNAAFSTSSALYFLNQNLGSAFSTSSALYFLSQYQNLAFSTTSANYWKSQNDFFSTSSAAYFLSQNQNAAFSTSSAQAFLAQNQNLAFSTSSAAYFLSQNSGIEFSTSSAQYFLAQNQGSAFSTSSLQYFLSATPGAAFSTTSTSYFLSQNQGAAFSTSSAQAFLGQNQGLAFSTSSASYFLSQNQNAAFSTSSASYFLSQNGNAAFSSSSAQYFLSQNQSSAFSTTSNNYWLSTKTSDNVTEGASNLYFTASRASTTAIAVLSATTSLPNILTLGGLSSATNLAAIGTLTAGSIGSGFGNINIGSNVFTGLGSGLSSLSASNVSSGILAPARGGTGLGTVVANQILIGNSSGTGWTQAATSSLGLSLSSISGLGTLASANSVNNSNWSGTQLSVANGGTGSTTLSGILKGNGTNMVATAVAGVDYQAPITPGSGLSFSGATLNSVWTQNGNSIYNNAGLNVGIGTTTLQNENTLTLGQTSYNPGIEGGQIDFLPGLSYSTSWDWDDYQGSFRLLRGTGTGSSTATIVTFASSTGNATFVGSVNAQGGLLGVCNSGSLLGLTSFTCSDMAESYPTYEDTVPGDIVAVPPAGDQTADATGMSEIGMSRGALGERVIGVVSTDPGLVLQGGGTYLGGSASGFITATTTIVALAGRIPVRVSLENGPIEAGDELAASPDIPGTAVKAVGAGMIVGTALSSYASPEDEDGTAAPTVMMFTDIRWSPGPDGEASAAATTTIGAHELCLDGVCLTKDQLIELFNRNGIFYSASPGASSASQQPSGSVSGQGGTGDRSGFHRDFGGDGSARWTPAASSSSATSTGSGRTWGDVAGVSGDSSGSSDPAAAPTGAGATQPSLAPTSDDAATPTAGVPVDSTGAATAPAPAASDSGSDASQMPAPSASAPAAEPAAPASDSSSDDPAPNPS